MKKNNLEDLAMAVCFIVTIFGVLPLAFYLVYWSLTVDGFFDALGWGLGGVWTTAFAVAVWRGLRGRREIRRIEQQTRAELADGWTVWVVDEHFGEICGQMARKGIYPDWHGEESIQSVLRGRLKRAGHL